MCCSPRGIPTSRGISHWRSRRTLEGIRTGVPLGPRALFSMCSRRCAFAADGVALRGSSSARRTRSVLQTRCRGRTSVTSSHRSKGRVPSFSRLRSTGGTRFASRPGPARSSSTSGTEATNWVVSAPWSHRASGTGERSRSGWSGPWPNAMRHARHSRRRTCSTDYWRGRRSSRREARHDERADGTDGSHAG